MSAERAQELERLYKARRSHDPHIPINNDNHHFLEAQNTSRPTTTRSWSSKHFSRLGGSYYASAGTQKQPPMSSLVPPRQSSLEPPSATAEESRPKICDDCEFEQNPLWNCSYCGMNFCDQCWDKQAQHRKGRTGPDGLPHEKANPAIVRRLKDILTPPVGHTEQQSLHVEDEDTTWFGLGRNSQNAPVFQDYGRYSTIMADSDTGDFKDRYPQLVSFIGQTGAGKSTLIKMLIDQQERKHSLQGWALPSPVAGTSTNGSVPTSGDVHLYSDPATYATEYPMLYADCEGLEGGENIPMAVQYRNSASGVQKEKSRDEHAPKEHRKRRMVSKGFHVVQKDIKWANSDTFKRQYAVTELYPRLLYTFSDVVVFVLRNAKTFESTVMELLIRWARSSIEKSLNQPTLPHAVIALNAADLKVDQQEWDPAHATRLLMSSVAGAVDRDPTYRQLRDYWIEKGRRIRCMKDLLECYYSSITVVRIPSEGRYMMIDQQVEKLHDVITQRCAESFNTKRRSRMLANSDNLNVYLQCAYDHFLQDLHTPFNFMDISFRINPIPLDFGGNILKLTISMKDRYSDPKMMFRELSQMVGSCLLLDSVRQSLIGPAEQILERQYLEHCDDALDDFCAMFLPCMYSNEKGQHCVNVKERHIKGHQDSRGRLIGSGPYEANFSFDSFYDDWFRYLKTYFTSFQNELSSRMILSPTTGETVVATKIHGDNINNFYYRNGGAQKFFNQSSCLCCLRELAEHPLPCGHVLCTPCVKGFGKPRDGLLNSYIIETCPLHSFDSIFPVAVDVRFKPPLAGLRILSLDGGGMRGIVILEVLNRVQNQLGHIQIQEFFDLIVGTSTGGILALGLGVKNWPINQCIDRFLNLVDKAFSPKFMGGVSLGTTKFKTKPLEEALHESFQSEALFGGRRPVPPAGRCKVAVTSAKDTAERAVVFTNYNRPQDDKLDYELVRPDDPAHDAEVWHAARATSAAPTFFKTFRHPHTKEGYIDGALYHNNPIRIAVDESKLIWPDTKDSPPDILLSIGTGQHGKDTDVFADAVRYDSRRAHIRQMLHQVKPTPKKKRSIPGLGALSEWESLWTVFKKRSESALDAELAWREFHKAVPHATMDRYVRVNPSTIRPTPRMDDKSQVFSLHEEIKAGLDMPHMKTTITEIAHRLIASSFYFHKPGPSRHNDGRVTVQGTIQCRFAAGSQNLRNLGHYLLKRQGSHFQPYFRVQEVNHDETAVFIQLTSQIIREMTDRGLFCLNSIAIPLTSDVSVVSIDLYLVDERSSQRRLPGVPISGFPRSLSDGDSLSLKRTTSPASPIPDRPRLHTKRASLREKRLTHPPLKSSVSDSDVSYANNNGWSPAEEKSPSDTKFPESPDDLSEWVRRHKEVRTARHDSASSQVTSDQEMHWPPPQPPQYNLETVSLPETSSYVPRTFLTEDGAGSHMHHDNVLDEEERLVEEALRRSKQDVIQPLRRTDTGTDPAELELAYKLSLNG